MRYFVESLSKFPRGDTKPLGSYLEVVTALHKLFPKRSWHTARRAIAEHGDEEIEIFLTTRRNKHAPPSLEKLLFPLIEAKLPSDLFIEISHAMILPDELITIMVLNNADSMIKSAVEWAVGYNWCVKEWPDGPALQIDA